MKSLKTFAAVLIAGAGLLGATAANAVATYTETFQGVTFTFTGDNGSTQFTLRIQNALSTTHDDWKDAAYIDSLGLKDLGVDFQALLAGGGSVSLSSSPAGTTSWNKIQGELNDAGCQDPGGQKKVICFTGAPPLAVTDDMLFTVTMTGATLNIASTGTSAGPHVKLRFLDAAGAKEGSLYSHNLPGADGGDGNDGGDGDGGLPEPNTLALLGLGLLGLGFGARRKLM